MKLVITLLTGLTLISGCTVLSSNTVIHDKPLYEGSYSYFDLEKGELAKSEYTKFYELEEKSYTGTVSFLGPKDTVITQKYNTGFNSEKLDIDPSIHTKINKYIDINTDEEGNGLSASIYASGKVGANLNHKPCIDTQGKKFVCFDTATTIDYDTYESVLEEDNNSIIKNPTIGTSLTYRKKLP